MIDIKSFQLHELLSIVQLWITEHYWDLIEVILIIIGCKYLNIIVGHLIKKLEPVAQNPAVFWDEALLIAIEKPIKVSIWIIGCTFIFDAVNDQIDINLLKFSPVIRNVTLITLISWVIIRFVNAFENNALKVNKKTKNNKFAADFSIKISKIVVFFIASLAIFENFGFNISGILALGGIGGAALAFASQSLLSNFFGTFIIYLDKPFVIGEKIFIKGEKVRGYVEEIGWRISMIRTQDQTPVYVQNAVFVRDSIVNYSRITHNKISEIIGISTPNMQKITKVTDEIYRYLEKLDYVDKEYNIIVVLHDFGHNFIEILIEAVVTISASKELLHARQEIMLNIHKILNKHKYQIVFSNDNKRLLTI